MSLEDEYQVAIKWHAYQLFLEWHKKIHRVEDTPIYSN